MKRILILVFAAISFSGVRAQNATNSPYSQYGYGILADQANGASVAMSGLSQGWREGNTVNFGNPASYSGTDSLTFVFDAGVSGQITNFNENGHKMNANNTSFDYVVAAFRLFRHVGCAFGVMPYSNVGYAYSNESTIGTDTSSGDTETTCTNTYSGEGGFHQGFVGIGIEPIKTAKTSISLGVNVSYIWGDYTKAVINSYSDAYVNTLSKYYKSDATGFKFDIGLQWQQRISKKDKITVGATYTIGHDLHSDPYCMIISNNSQTGVADTTTYYANGKLAIPTTITAGFVWNHNNKWRAGLDWKMEKWESIDYPVYEVVNTVPTYSMKSGQFKNRNRFTVGGEYCHKENGRRWLDKVRYRFGATYATSYLRINDEDGPKEYGVSLGVGVPIINTYNNRSMLNISASWTHQDTSTMIKENTFRISIGLTFNERWFAKWQVE